MPPDATYPDEIYRVDGQIDRSERELYYRLARNGYQGVGEIVEVGSLFGASTSCFAAGLRDNPNVVEKAKRLHCFDRFEVYPAIQPVFRTLNVGDDFSALFVNNVLQYEQMLRVTKCDARKIVWDRGPIEILFIDCAVSAELYQAVMHALYPSLIPGTSLIVDQDFFFPAAWWLPVKNRLLQTLLSPLKSADCTLVSRLTQPLGSAIAQIDFAGLTLDQRLNLLDDQRKFFGTGGVGELIQVQKGHLLLASGERERGTQLLKSLITFATNPAASERAAESLKEFGISAV